MSPDPAHFLMELHVGLCAAVPNAAYVEYILPLDPITTSRLAIVEGHAVPSDTPGIGVVFDWPAVARLGAAAPIVLNS